MPRCHARLQLPQLGFRTTKPLPDRVDIGLLYRAVSERVGRMRQALLLGSMRLRLHPARMLKPRETRIGGMSAPPHSCLTALRGSCC